MHDADTSLAALIGSRICHDLISPVGAINNGLELLSMSGQVSGPEINLIGESVGNASARIRFFRIAFGAASDQQMGAAEVTALLKDLYGDSRLETDWSIDIPVRRAEVRLALLSIMCAETAMPFGGHVSVRLSDKTWTVQATSDRFTLEPTLWDNLSQVRPTAGMPPAQVQFALLPLAAKEQGRHVRVSSKADSLSLEF